MAVNLADSTAYPGVELNRESRSAIGDVAFTAGAVGVQTWPDPQFNLVRTGAGAYTLTTPACPKGRLTYQIVSPAKTIQNVITLTESATTGTYTFVTLNNAGANTDPANADMLHIYFDGEARS